MESTRLCPKCGAYWKCDCAIEQPQPPPQRLQSTARLQRSAEPAGLIPAPAACQHDWSEVVGVELDDDAVLGGEAQVMVCRLCGLYAVEKSA